MKPPDAIDIKEVRLRFIEADNTLLIESRRRTVITPIASCYGHDASLPSASPHPGFGRPRVSA
jgi:hypothetical protein